MLIRKHAKTEQHCPYCKSETSEMLTKIRMSGPDDHLFFHSNPIWIHIPSEKVIGNYLCRLGGEKVCGSILWDTSQKHALENQIHCPNPLGVSVQ